VMAPSLGLMLLMKPGCPGLLPTSKKYMLALSGTSTLCVTYTLYQKTTHYHLRWLQAAV
jgi:hypothetical protein